MLCNNRSITPACFLKLSFWVCSRYGHATARPNPASLSWTSTWRPLSWSGVCELEILPTCGEGHLLPCRQVDIRYSNDFQGAPGKSNGPDLIGVSIRVVDLGALAIYWLMQVARLDGDSA